MNFLLHFIADINKYPKNPVTFNPLLINSTNKICNSKDNPRFTTFNTKYEPL
jgi:hypothetical protein